MELFGFFSGSAPVIKKYQIGEAMTTAGVPVVIGGSNKAGIVLGDTTTASVDLVGVTLDSQATLVTAQQTDNSDPSRVVSVVVNPDAMWRARLSGGATADTALAIGTVDNAVSNGLTVDTNITYTNFDEGSLFGYKGGAVGILRKITSVSSTIATVTVAFPVGSAVGDQYLHVPFSAGEAQFVQLTSNLAQVDASATVDTDNNNFRVIELEMKDHSEVGVSNSSVILVAFDHLFAAGGSI